MQYHCDKCQMGVKGMTCAKCNAELIPDKITKEDGTIIQVAKCPNGCGKIKSPQCCGIDMKTEQAENSKHS